jgi:hypothetical protein
VQSRTSEVFTVEEVRKGFERLTGDTLEVERFHEDLAGVIPPVHYLSFNRVHTRSDGTEETLPISESLLDKYGHFVIAVYESHVPPKPGIPEKRVGVIRWLTLFSERGPRPGKYFAAVKTYGRNIELRWYPDSRRRETNAQWERLDQALSSVVT